MTSHAMDEIANALRACEDAGMSPERVGGSLGDFRFAFLLLSGRSSQVSEKHKRSVARQLRQALVIWRLEQDCLAGRFANALLRYGS